MELLPKVFAGCSERGLLLEAEASQWGVMNQAAHQPSNERTLLDTPVREKHLQMFGELSDPEFSLAQVGEKMYEIPGPSCLASERLRHQDQVVSSAAARSTRFLALQG